MPSAKRLVPGQLIIQEALQVARKYIFFDYQRFNVESSRRRPAVSIMAANFFCNSVIDSVPDADLEIRPALPIVLNFQFEKKLRNIFYLCCCYTIYGFY